MNNYAYAKTEVVEAIIAQAFVPSVRIADERGIT